MAFQNIETSNPDNDVEQTTSNPNEELGFEINPPNERWTFIPEFYPSSLTQMKKKELTRFGGNCGSESVSIKAIKNREIHVTGLILEGEVSLFNSLMDMEETVDVYSPLMPNSGLEAHIKKAELGNQKGWDPHTNQWMFEYTIDFVSTGKDEADNQGNGIVTALIGDKFGASAYGM
jgi:hypothetical protein